MFHQTDRGIELWVMKLKLIGLSAGKDSTALLGLSMTQRGAKLQITKAMLDEEDFNEDDSHLSCQSGLCE